MEYIKKEELIEGEVYYVSTTCGFWMIGLVTKSNNGDNGYNSFRGNATYISKEDEELITDSSWCYEADGRTYRLATSEEKHWLETCIKLDKFITFEEAMKTFIPEYIECIAIYGHCEIGEIYDTKDDNLAKSKCSLSWYQILVTYPNLNTRFKPSTKEAYDAQFVVKEPEFVLPEKWCIFRTYENHEIINKWFKDNGYSSPSASNTIIAISENKYSYTSPYDGKLPNHKEITFEEFKKYVLKEEVIVEEKVIKPLPQFKVIESIETITKVENNEGNQFFIGDVVKSLSNVIYNITKFEYNEDKTQIIAILNETSRFDINQIEHYIEPKVEETLLEKAKIIEHSHDFKIGNKIKIKLGNREFDFVYKIIKIEDNVLFFGNSIHSRVLAKNVIKVN